MFRKLATLGVAGVVGISLIGAGVSATFTQTTQSYQQVTAGTMHVTLSGTGVLSNNNETLTLPAVPSTASSFTTGDQLVTITNQGNITVSEILEQIGVTGDTALKSELSVCEVSSGFVIYNGLLSGGLYQQAISGTLAPNATDNYIINVYAGNETTACGAVTSVGTTAVSGTSTAPDLDNAVQGQTDVVSVTLTYQG
jgi:hypothetical protein